MPLEVTASALISRCDRQPFNEESRKLLVIGYCGLLALENREISTAYVSNMGSSIKDVTTTLRYLATGLVDWEKIEPDKRFQVPQSLRLGMSRMYAASALTRKPVPTTLPELFEWAARSIKSWEPAQTLSTIPDNATLIEDGLVSDFA